MNKKTKRAFTHKVEVVDLVRQADGNAAKVARKVSLTPQTVSAWVHQAFVDDGKRQPVELTTAERTELLKLRREHKDLRIECETLKDFDTVREGEQRKFAAIDRQRQTYTLQ